MRRLLHLMLLSVVLTFACCAPGAHGHEIRRAPARDIGDVLDPGPLPGALWCSESWLQLQDERARRLSEWRNVEELRKFKRARDLRLEMRRQHNDAY
jgi:hypothetical protein